MIFMPADDGRLTKRRNETLTPEESASQGPFRDLLLSCPVTVRVATGHQLTVATLTHATSAVAAVSLVK
ncbi:hypothetical protein ACLKA6_006463 [Drosophila palustris]